MAWLRSAIGTAVVLGFVAAVACKAQTKSGPPENTSKPIDALDMPNHPGIETCRGSISSGEIESNLEIARDFRDSCHEMVVCGGINASLSVALVTIMINAAAGKKADEGGMVFDGKGTWATPPTKVPGSTMDVKFHLGFDTSFGKTNDLVTFNVLDLSTYFTGAIIKATATVNTKGEATSSLTMEFTGLGPGIELLGLGPKPASPIKIDANEISAALGKLQLAAKIHINDKQGNALFRYELETPLTPLSAITAGDPTKMKLLDISGERADVGQKLTVTAFDIEYRNIGSGYLDGDIGFDITGGKYFPYSAIFHYPRRSAPDVSLSCDVGKKPAFDGGVSDSGGETGSDAGTDAPADGG